MQPRALARDFALEAAKSSPLIAYWSAKIGGLTIADWAALATLAYTLLLILDKLRGWGLFRWLNGVLGRP